MSLSELKKKKAKAKGIITITRRQLLVYLEGETCEKTTIRDSLEELSRVVTECTDVMLALLDIVDEADEHKIHKELDILQEDHRKAVDLATAKLAELSRNASRATTSGRATPMSPESKKKIEQVRQSLHTALAPPTSVVASHQSTLATLVETSNEISQEDMKKKDIDVSPTPSSSSTCMPSYDAVTVVTTANTVSGGGVSCISVPTVTTDNNVGGALAFSPAVTMATGIDTAVPDLQFRRHPQQPARDRSTLASQSSGTATTSSYVSAAQFVQSATAQSVQSTAAQSVQSSAALSVQPSVAQTVPTILSASVQNRTVSARQASVVAAPTSAPIKMSPSVSSRAGQSASQPAVKQQFVQQQSLQQSPHVQQPQQQQHQYMQQQQYPSTTTGTSGYNQHQQPFYGSATNSTGSYYQNPQPQSLYPQQSYNPAYTSQQSYNPVYTSQQYQQPGYTPMSNYYSPVQAIPNVPPPVDPMKHMKHVKPLTIPVFSGEKRSYASWKAAFMASIGHTSATDELKLLHLRQYLRGEALDTIDSLGFTASAYPVALQRLEKKYGGVRRQLHLQMELVDAFPVIKPGRAQELQKFAELLEVTQVVLLDNGRQYELGDGVLYNKLQAKLSASMLITYKRWKQQEQMSEGIATLLDWVNSEAEFATEASETIHGIEATATTTRSKPNSERHQGRVLMASKQEGYQSKCTVCGDAHAVWSCPKFQAMDIDKRWDTAKEKKLCYRCLRGGHPGKDCRRMKRCGVDKCSDTHNWLLHRQQREEQTQPTTNNSDSPPSSKLSSHVSSHASANVPSSKVTLRVVPVILSNAGRQLQVNAMLDDGSTDTLVSSEVASELGLDMQFETVSVMTLNGHQETFTSAPVEFGLSSLDGKVELQMSADTVPAVSPFLQPINWNKEKQQWKHLRGIQFHEVTEKNVDLLIGLQHSDLHVSLQEVVGNPGEPVARRTPLGWTCVGRVSQGRSSKVIQHGMKVSSTESLEDTLAEFWSLEEFFTSSQPLSLDDEEAIEQVQMKYIDGRYEVGLPWKTNGNDLPDNRAMATKRLLSTEKKLMKDEMIAKSYSETLEQYIQKGYIREVPPEEKQPERRWYLPHFAVVKEDRTTTKTRIVFDASAQYAGKSLNDAIHTGPKLQRSLLDVLLRFRHHPVAIVCDIAEMYLQIGIKEEQRSCLRFLWRNLDTSVEPKEYEFNRVVFGVNASPFLAQYVSQQHAKEHQESHPRAAETIDKSTYMDDSMDSEKSEQAGIQLYHELSSLWGLAGMRARKWLSNSSEVLKEIPEEERAKEIDLEVGSLPSIKTLGVLWIAEEDVFSFKHREVESNSADSYTKRSFLKVVATVFDPLGLATPVVIVGRQVLQDIWIGGYDWDDPLPESLNTRIVNWIHQLKDMSTITVPRCLQENKEVKSAKIHVFSDASMIAYGAAAYYVVQYSDGTVSSRFVASRVKVAPVNSVSIPRLELQAAVMGSQLATSVSKTLDVPMTDVVLWSDSTNVLWWISNRSRAFKPFVGNRVAEIQRLSSPSQWRHVPGEHNPADLLSRGTTVDVLCDSKLWWEGPEYLQRSEDEWPPRHTQLVPASESTELRKEAIAMHASVSSPVKQHVVAPDRYSRFKKHVRVTAYILRFVENCRMPAEQREYATLTSAELHDAELYIVRTEQQLQFPVEYDKLKKKQQLPQDSKLIGLTPFLDDDEVIRMQGRLQHAEYLSYNSKHPVILPRTSSVTQRIIMQYHEEGQHNAGVNHVLSNLMAEYWILGGREAVKEAQRNCPTCQRKAAKPATQQMAPLPSSRLKEPLRAFGRVAVDYAGPFVTMQGRGKRRQKRYLALFTCLTSRAVHLEVAYDMSTDAFLNAFYRFANRRGLPSEMISDNGTNFVGAANELRELRNVLTSDQMDNSLANKGVKWSFNPPAAPHFGGVHEAMIKSAKKGLYAVIGNADVNDEELVSAVTGVESLLNSRPLMYVSGDPNDNVPLTPNHFLIGMVGGQFAPESVDEVGYSPKRRWRYVQELVNQAWKRWMKEWVPLLNRRHKWLAEQRNITVGDIVLVISQDTPRGKWPMGRVISVYPGKDGKTRVAKVQIGTKTLVRPITRLCYIPLDV